MTTATRTQFEEPWIRNGDTVYKLTTDYKPWLSDRVHSPINLFSCRVQNDNRLLTEKQTEAFAERIRACVNACGGLPNPEAVPELVKVVKNFLLYADTRQLRTVNDLDHNVVPLRAALANAEARP